MDIIYKLQEIAIDILNRIPKFIKSPFIAIARAIREVMVWVLKISELF